MERKKPSEYIRIGIGIRPRHLTGFFADEDKSCVLGALTEGIAGHALWWGSSIKYQKIVEPVFPELFVRRAMCPVCPALEDELTVIVTHLNDSHVWSRERIGKWLDAVIGKAPEVVERDAVADETPERVERQAEQGETSGSEEREEELVGV
jgi:hypothetical protein